MKFSHKGGKTALSNKYIFNFLSKIFSFGHRRQIEWRHLWSELYNPGVIQLAAASAMTATTPLPCAIKCFKQYSKRSEYMAKSTNFLILERQFSCTHIKKKNQFLYPQ